MSIKWLAIAESKIGEHEVRGGENPFILACHDTTTLHAKEDEIPWCSSFVNWCISQAGIHGTNSAAAASWINWGDKLVVPRIGCVTVIRQRQKGVDSSTGSCSGNHVGFYFGQEGKRIFLLGGNQHDSVKVSSFNLASYDVIAYRWPIGV